MELNNFIQENVLNLIQINLLFIILSAYNIPTDIIYFEINHRNGSIYILHTWKIKISKYCLRN